MRNLKRALSLLLAAAMLIGMMVVGASAVSYNDFPDRDEIVNKDAVSMLTTLGIIEGTDQGTYNPTGDVDRAQMAKMISVALTNNEDCDTLYQNVNSGLTDIAANWARGYINYCYTLGIIAGRGNNTFDPSANVTGVEAAKMLLTALGYDANIEGLVGNDWALNTAALAQNLGIFRNFTKDVSAPLNRDDAALLIYNALDVELIQEYRNGYAISYDDHRTILSSVFGVIRVEGVVIGNEWAQLEETDSDAALQEGRTRLEDVVWYDSTTANTVVDEGVEVTEPVTFNVATPVDYMGKAVTLYVEKTTILSNSKVIGVATNDDLNVVQGTAANSDDVKDLLKGTGLAVDKDTQYYVNYGYHSQGDAIELVNDYALGASGSKFNLNGVEVEIIDNNNDGAVEYVLYTRETLSNVVRTSAKDETVTINMPIVNGDGLLTYTGSGTNRVSTTTEVLDNADIVTELELAAEDDILYVQYGGRTYITAPETVVGKMTRVDRDQADELYITIDNGDTYRMSYIREVLSQVDADVTRFDITNARTEPGFDNTYEFILDSNGYIVAYRPAEDVVRNYGLVLDSAWTQNALTKSGEVKILTTGAIEQNYTINWGASNDAFKGMTVTDNEGNTYTSDTEAGLDSKLEAYLGTRDVNTAAGSAQSNLGAAKGTVIEYTLTEDNILTIKNVLNLNTLDGNGNLVVSSDRDADNIDVDVTGEPIAYMEANNAAGKATNNLQYTLNGGYKTGDGSLAVTAQGENMTFAIDRNTIAFYYDVVDPDDVNNVNGRYYKSGYEAGDVLYGVATGWEQMGDVADDAAAQVYPVITKQGGVYTASALADVVLFNYELTTDTADWMLVLNANAVNASTLELNVVFEDGTTAAIEVDKDDYNHFNSSSSYMQAYKYSVNANGKYTINTADGVAAVPASLLRDGTVDANRYGYLTIVGDTKIWDVTDVDNAEDEVVAGSFDYANAKNAVVIRTNSGKTLKTAWVWDMDGDANYGTSCTFDWSLSNYETIWFSNTGDTLMDWFAYNQMQEAFEAGKNVMVRGNLTLGFPIEIPAGLTLQVWGNLDTNGYPIYGAGSLRVDGTYTVDNESIQVPTQVRHLIINDDQGALNTTVINADTHVQYSATLNTPAEAATGVHFCVRGDRDWLNGNGGLVANAAFAIKGHVEVTDFLVNAPVTILSTNTLVVNDRLHIVAPGVVNVGGATRGSLVVESTGSVTGDGALNVVNGTVTLTRTAQVNMTGALTVANGSSLTQSYISNPEQIFAGTMNINGEVDVFGDLITTGGNLVIGAKGEVSTNGEINAVAPHYVIVYAGGVANGTLPTASSPNTPGTGDITYTGDADESGTTPPPQGSFNVVVKVDGQTVNTQTIKENESYEYTYPAPEGKIIDTASMGTIAADKKSVTISIEKVTASVTIDITTKVDEGGNPEPQPGELPAATWEDTADHSKGINANFYTTATTLTDSATLAAIGNTVMADIEADLGIDLLRVTVASGAATATAVDSEGNVYNVDLTQYFKVTVDGTTEIYGAKDATTVESSIFEVGNAYIIPGTGAGSIYDTAADATVATAGQLSLTALSADVALTSVMKVDLKPDSGMTVAAYLASDPVNTLTNTITDNSFVATTATLQITGANTNNGKYTELKINGTTVDGSNHLGTADGYRYGVFSVASYVDTAENGTITIEETSGYQVRLVDGTVLGITATAITSTGDFTVAGTAYGTSAGKDYVVLSYTDGVIDGATGTATNKVTATLGYDASNNPNTTFAFKADLSGEAADGVITLAPAVVVDNTDSMSVEYTYGDMAAAAELSSNTLVAEGAVLTVTNSTAGAGFTVTVGDDDAVAYLPTAEDQADAEAEVEATDDVTIAQIEATDIGWELEITVASFTNGSPLSGVTFSDTNSIIAAGYTTTWYNADDEELADTTNITATTEYKAVLTGVKADTAKYIPVEGATVTVTGVTGGSATGTIEYVEATDSFTITLDLTSGS